MGIPAVKDLPFVDSLRELTKKEQSDLGLIMPSGHRNDYRVETMKGRGASSKDSTFDPTLGHRGGHSCCGSKVTWRHKASCPMLKFEEEHEDVSR